MKKLIPWLVIAVVVILVVLLMAGTSHTRERRFDDHVTLREKDEIPYGTSAARRLLPSLVPGAYVTSNNHSPLTLYANKANGTQAEIFFSDHFNADKDELRSIYEFARTGNSVYIISRTFSEETMDFFGFNCRNRQYTYVLEEDSLFLHFARPAFPSDTVYSYPGRRYDNEFMSLDTIHTQVLGRGEFGYPDFIGFSVGQGTIYIHSAPLAFSNYFVLHKGNVDYFRGAMSVLPSKLGMVEWNEYYLTKKDADNEQKQPNLFAVLLRYPGLKWGLLLGLGLMILLLLLGSRRRQRKIPPYTRPQNDSLDFVKTVGRLYYDRRDHRNLALKMATYFLEHVRSTYKLPTHTLDEEFVRVLHFKSGYPVEKLQAIMHTIFRLRDGASITEGALAEFHNELELFYQNT